MNRRSLGQEFANRIDSCPGSGNPGSLKSLAEMQYGFFEWPKLFQFFNQDFGSEIPLHERKMRMMLNRSSQLVLASAASLLAAGLLTACGTLTVDSST